MNLSKNSVKNFIRYIEYFVSFTFLTIKIYKHKKNWLDVANVKT